MELKGQVIMVSGAEGHVAPPPQAGELFGPALPTMRQYADLLSGAGVERGLIGPREVPRLWERHLMNCGVVEELVPHAADVIDIGSGAGLPGIVLGIMRPDISVLLLEPLLRRTVFLQECVAELGLTNVAVQRGRAEEMSGALSADVVTARAVAPLARLAGWALPLLRPGGQLLALKGEQAAVELAAARTEMAKLSKVRFSAADVIQVGSGKVDPATTVVRVTVTSESDHAAGAHRRRTPGGGKKRGRKR